MRDVAGAVQAIEIRLHSVESLFASLDPSPFRERDLDPAAEAYIMDWARETPARARLALRLHFPPEEAERARRLGVPAAVTAYFADRRATARRELRDFFRTAFRYLVIGLAVLSVCLVLSQIARTSLGDRPAAHILAESLVILGWVANWKPLELFLYEWWPIRDRAVLCRRLEAAAVEIVG